MLSQPVSEQTGNSGEHADPVPHPQIGLACSLLNDTGRQGLEVRPSGVFLYRFVFSLIAVVSQADELKSRIVMFFGMLSNAHPDAYTLLVESQELIPSIVLYLCHLTAPIWDENGVILNDPQAATR